jgi:hypothetical protein
LVYSEIQVFIFLFSVDKQKPCCLNLTVSLAKVLFFCRIGNHNPPPLPAGGGDFMGAFFEQTPNKPI